MSHDVTVPRFISRVIQRPLDFGIGIGRFTYPPPIRYTIPIPPGYSDPQILTPSTQLSHLMFPTLRFLATQSSQTSGLTLLPPLVLYRRLLRIHRKKLPYDARLLGDEYVKREFRLHRDVKNPLHIVGFLTEWQLYAQQLEGDTWRGGALDQGKLEKMSDDQIVQLYEMMKAIKSSGGVEGSDGGVEGSAKSS